MKIAFNPSTVAALIAPPNNKDITFDLRGRNIFARGVKFHGTDTWRDIKINNVSIDSNILDLQNGSNTTLTNTNGVVTINSTWRPVVDNLISDSTTSSLSANQGRVLAGLINGHPQIIDMRNYDESYWHPVTVQLLQRGYNKIKVSVQLNSGDKPSWATHSSGFTCNMEIWATAHGWGTTNAETICLNYTYAYCNSNPCGWKQLGYSSLGVLFLRGGSRYKVWTDFDATFTPHDKTYTWTGEGHTQSTGGPYTSCPDLNFIKNRIYANLEGSASYLEGGSIPNWGTLTTANGFTNVSSFEYGSRGAYGLCSQNNALYMQLDGYFYQNEGKYRVIDTSDFNWTNLPGKIVAENEFNIVNAGFNNRMWFNYLPINDRNKTATITGYSFGNGAQGYASVQASGFVKTGSSNNYVLLGDGGHQIISRLSVNYANSAGSATKVIVNQHTANDTNYPLVWSNQNNTDNVTENQLYKSWSDLYYNPKYKRLTVGGSIYAAHFYESSDKVLKKNIKSILSSTNIPKIREFDWKDTGEHSYGFIAQELEEQGYGCLVSKVNGKKTVNYTATLALTIAKLQNLINIQNKKISNLTKELKALKYGRKKNS